MKRKKLAGGILAVILSISMAMPAFAADIPGEETTLSSDNILETTDANEILEDEPNSTDIEDNTPEEEMTVDNSGQPEEDTKAEESGDDTEQPEVILGNKGKTVEKQSANETVQADTNVENSVWTTEDFTYTTMEQTLNGCDYTREFTIKGRAIAGFSEYGEEKVKTNKNLVLPSTDDNGETLVGVASNAFKNMGLETVEFPTGMMVDYNDTVTHVVTRRGNFVIGSSAFYGNNLTSVYLPEGVIAVMSMAFSSNQLKSVTLPHTIWWIENQSFAKNQLTTVGFPKTCDFQLQIHAMAFAQNNIQSVRLPDYTEVVDKRAFYWNPGMEDCPADAPENEGAKFGGVVYMYTDNPNLVNMERIHHIDRTAPSQKSYHQRLIVGEDPNANQTWSLDDFTIEGTTITGLSPSGVGKRAVNKNLVLPDRNASGEYITELADTTNDTGLFAAEGEQFESVVLPCYLERIGNRAFCNSGIQRIEFPLTLKEIGIAAFQRNKLTSVILPDSVVTLGGGAFGTNPQLEQIILSRGLTEIPAGAFGCSTADEWMAGLTQIEIPEGITVIGNNAFAGNNFTQINIPSTVKEIGNYAFSTKNYLKDTVCTVTLPEGLEKIGSYAFRNKIVETLELPETVKAFPANVFTREYSDSTQAMVTLIYVNETQISDKTNFPDSEYHKFVLRDDPSDIVWSAYDFTYGEVEPKTLYDVAMTEEVEVSGWGVTGFTENGLKKLGRNPELVIPEKDPEGRQVTAIADNAFKYDADTMPQKIASVTFPQNVKAAYEGRLSDKNERGNFLIMGMAFYGQGLKEITLPEGVLLVGRQAFAKNELTHVTLPETVWWIEQGAFIQNQITIVDFPATCDFKMNIDAQAFAINQIVSVALPDRTEKVNKWAFLQNTGKEPVTEGSSAEKKGGIVYMYGDEVLNSEAQIAHIDNTGNKSNVQKLVIGVQDPAEQPWNTIHFTYEGTKVTGLSEAGQAKRTVDQNLRIPDLTPNGEYVTEIGNGGAYGTFGAEGETFENVTLPSRLQVIGNSAFAQNTMTKLDLLSTLTTIGSAAFRASGLTEIVLPDSVTEVGAGAFATCTDLEKVTLSKNMTQIEQSVFAMTAVKEVSIPEGVTEIGRMAFNGAPVESLVIPNTVTEIGANAFATNRLTELTIPGSVKCIGSSAFSQYSEQSPSSLKTLVLGEGLEEIGRTAFRKCALTTVEIPSTLVSLAENTFQDGAAGQVILYSKNPAHLQKTDTFIPESEGHKVVYSNLIGTGWSYDDFTFDGSVLTGWSDKGNVTRKEVKNLVLPEINPETGEAVTEIGENAFKIPDDEIEQLKDSVCSPNGMETVSIPETVTKIGKKAFEYNNFVEMGFGAAVTDIGESAFHGNKLTKVVIPDTVTALGAGAFSENNIIDLTLSRNVTVIPQGAFSMNIRLEQVTIPDTVTEIGEMAFAGARLTSLEIPASVEKIGRRAFHLHHLTELTVPGSVKEIGESAFEGTFKAITLRNLTLEEGVEKIGKYAFKEGYLESVQLPSSLKEMGEEPFYGNSGTNGDHIVVCYTMNPEHLKFGNSGSHRIVYQGQWGTDCFTYEGTTVTGLTDKGREVLQVYPYMVIPSQTPEGTDVAEIAPGAFKGCGITGVVLPEKLQKIGEGAFAGNALTSINIPDGVTIIEEDAFADNGVIVKLIVTDKDCYERLKNIVLEGAQIVFEEQPEQKPGGGSGDGQSSSSGNGAETASDQKGAKAVRTGDTQSAIAVMTVMVAALVVIAVSAKRKKENK